MPEPVHRLSSSDPRSWYRAQHKAIGTITPSGNIVVERMTTAILADFPAVSGHFSRIEVVGSTDAYKDDYDWDGMMRAAELLSHAEPDVICWNGSKGGSIGLDADRRLCERITAATGKPATTSSLAILEAFATTGVRRIRTGDAVCVRLCRPYPAALPGPGLCLREPGACRTE